MNFIQINGTRINYVNKEKHFEEAGNGLWEPETFRVIDEYLSPGKVFLDIGAWVGTLSIYAAKNGCEVIAVEPDTEAIKMFVENAKANGYDILSHLNKSIKLIGDAVSDKWNIKTEFYMEEEFGDSMSSLVKTDSNKEPKYVTSRPFKSILQPQSGNINNICLIKIDIEGSESLIMNDETLAALTEMNLPPILLSLHPQLIDNYEEWYDNFVYTYGQHYEIEEIAKDTILLK